MGFLAAIPFRLYLYAGIAAFIGLLLWHDHHLSKLYKAQKAATEQVEASLEQERRNAAQVQADLKLNQVTSHALQERLSAIERERRTDPLPRLRCTASVPSSNTQGGTSRGPDGSSTGRESEAVEVDFDPTPALDEYGADCAVIAERLTALQQWERDRSH